MTALIFDLDGTLIDSAPDIHAAVTRVLADEGATPLSPDLVRSFIGNGVPALITRVMTARGEAPDDTRAADLAARFLRHYEAAPIQQTTMYPGVAGALAELEAAGYRIGLCTNKPAVLARAILAAFGIERHFAAVVGGDSLPQRKPRPEPLHAARNALGGGNVVCVGDSEVDAAAADAAGMPLLLFTRGYRKTPVERLPHLATFDDFSMLPGLVTGVAPLSTGGSDYHAIP